MRYTYEITPCPKPRQTQSDRWKKRPCVLRYRAFADECRLKKVTINHGDSITFIVPMAKSWGKQVKYSYNGTPHQIKPDLDNYLKAIFDAVCKKDEVIWRITAQKVWGYTGAIVIERVK